MISRRDLELKNEWWANSQYKIEESQWPRRDLFYLLKDNIDHSLMLNIVGLRRVGKSTLLKQLIAEFLEQKINSQNIFYFLFDYASQIKKAEFFDEVLAFYFREILNKPGLQLDERVYIFLDEVQYIEDWQAVLKKYYDLSNKKIKFIVTGSQSVLLKGKNKESLAGRIFDYYLPPLSFSEFLRINKEEANDFKKFDLFDLPEKFAALSGYNAFFGKKIADLSREYLIAGQFPESRQFSSVELKHEYIADSVLGKVLEDCIHIFKIDKTDEFKLFAYQLINNIGSIFELKNIGREIAVSQITLDKYMEYLRESYVAEILYKYHKSPIKKGRITKKLYTPCVNFNSALNRYKENHIDEVPQAFGKIIENIIYNVLASKYKNNELMDSLSFWRQGEKEIDFIIAKNKKQLAIEVKFSKSIDYKDLAVLTDYTGKKKLEYGIVITRNEIDKKIINGQTLYFIPYYLVLLME
ncbi:MAG: ATP-binding protein [Patescibacteria group bacterium]